MTVELQLEAVAFAIVVDDAGQPWLLAVDPDDELMELLRITVEPMIEYGEYVMSTTPVRVEPPRGKVAGRRPSHMERCFTREGGRHVVRKDHGTTARRKQIEATNARWAEGAQKSDGRRALRRELRKALYGGQKSAYEIAWMLLAAE